MTQNIEYYLPLPELADRSALLTLDFTNITPDCPTEASIQDYFKLVESRGENPRTAQNRQAFNNNLLDISGLRYLVSRYGEDRTSMLEGSSIIAERRTLHLGVDIFSKNQEVVFSPCDGEIVAAGNEPEDHSFGYYVIIKPDNFQGIYIFLGHLSKDIPTLGKQVTKAEQIAILGDFEPNHENGGWSRHLHLQLFTKLPKSSADLIGYTSEKDFAKIQILHPNPNVLFPFLDTLKPVENLLNY